MGYLDYIDTARETLNKAYGADVTYLMSDVSSAAEDSIPTGITAFDWGLLGIGGVPRRHFFELSGDDKTGKTTMVIHMIASCQSEDIVPLVIDTSGRVSTDPPRAKRIGANPEGIVIVPVDSSDEALMGTRLALRKLRKADIPVAFFWDDMGLTPSVAELTPGIDKKTKREKTKPGAQAKVIWQFCRSLAGECYEAGAPMVVVNQIQSVINTGFGAQYAPKETTAAGGGLKYAARIRAQLKLGAKIKKNNKTIGRVIYASTLANAFYPPFARVALHLDFRNGFDSDRSTIINALSSGVMKKSRGKYKLRGAPRGTKFTKLDDDMIWGAELQMWPWIGEDYEYDGEVEGEEEEDSEEAEEDEFADGYSDW